MLVLLRRVLLTALVALSATSISHAQFVPIGPGVADVMMPVIMNPCPDNKCPSAEADRSDAPIEAALAGLGRRNGVSLKSSSDRATPSTRFPTTYPVTQAAYVEARDAFIKRIERSDGKVARIVAPQLRQHDIGQAYGNLVRPLGFRRGDVADAMTAFTLLNWALINDELGDRPDDRIKAQAARSQVAALVSGNDLFATQRDRQQIGMELEILFVILHASIQSAATREGPAALQQLRAGVRTYFQEKFGEDLQQFTLSSRGLQKRG